MKPEKKEMKPAMKKAKGFAEVKADAMKRMMKKPVTAYPKK